MNHQYYFFIWRDTPTLPNPVPSFHATLCAHVSQTHTNKIINGEYIELALLLENTTISEKQEKREKGEVMQNVSILCFKVFM
jgi:hypothetical protein